MRNSSSHKHQPSEPKSKKQKAIKVAATFAKVAAIGAIAAGPVISAVGIIRQETTLSADYARAASCQAKQDNYYNPQDCTADELASAKKVKPNHDLTNFGLCYTVFEVGAVVLTAASQAF